MNNKHDLEKYGYVEQNTRNKHLKNNGIRLLKDGKSSVKVVVETNVTSSGKVMEQILRHIDHVVCVYCDESDVDKHYTLPNNKSDIFDTIGEAVLNYVDPEGDLGSLEDELYVITVSDKPDDTVKSSSTGRTRYAFKTMAEVLEQVFQKPFIHRLDGRFTEKQKCDLIKYSLRVQKMKGISEEREDLEEVL